MGLIEKMKWKASMRNRKRKLQYILKHISKGKSIIDVGVSPCSLGRGTNYLEEYFLKANIEIYALGLNNLDYSYFRNRYKNCKLHLFDGFSFPSFPKKFDIALSNAVIEHVGDYQLQLEWLMEISKLCDKLIITTPNKFFPVEAHTNTLFIHWFKPGIRKYLLRLFHLPESLYEGYNLLSKKEFVNLLEEAGFEIMKIKKNKLLFLTMDFVIIAKGSADISVSQ